MKDSSGWTVAPHPLAVSTETVDEATNESTGRGLLARRSVNVGDKLLQIPMRLCLTKDSCLESLSKDCAISLPKDTNEYLVIAAYIIHEKYLNPSSFWSPYLSVLPSTADVGPTFTWSVADLDQLSGSPVVAASMSMRAKLEREREALLGENGLDPELYTYERWEWAFTILFSRAIRLRSLKDGEAVALVPYVDLINHSAFSQCFVDAREAGDWIFKTGEDEVVLYADRGYRKMEQIYISYGQKSNAELLLLYGFALERNPYNSVDVSVSLRPGGGDELDEEKRDFLKRAGRGDEAIDFPCYADRYPREMLEYLRLMLLTRQDMAGKALDDFDFSRPVSRANERAALEAVKEAVQLQISKYPTTEEEDASMIRDKFLFASLSKNARMAVRHRRNEKRLLKRTQAALEKEIAEQERGGGRRGEEPEEKGSWIEETLAVDFRRKGQEY